MKGTSPLNTDEIRSISMCSQSPSSPQSRTVHVIGAIDTYLSLCIPLTLALQRLITNRGVKNGISS